MRARKKSKSGVLPTNELLDIIKKTLEDSKTIDIIVIDLEGKTDITDKMIISEGRSDRHIRSIAEHLITKLKEIGQPYIVEGLQTGEWVLVDAYSVIVHIFHKETREKYKLENLWQS